MSHSKKNNEVNQYTDIESLPHRNNQVSNQKSSRRHVIYDDKIDGNNQYSEPEQTSKKRHYLNGWEPKESDQTSKKTNQLTGWGCKHIISSPNLVSSTHSSKEHISVNRKQILL